MTGDAAARAAELLQEAMRSRKPLARLPDACRPRSLPEAYAIQARFAALLGSPVGYKIGYTNPAVQRRFGVPGPISGRLLAERILRSPAELPAAAPLLQAAEPEFALRLAEGLPRAEAPFDRERVAGAIEAVVPSLEIVESRFADWERIGALQTVADNVLGSHWVGGAPARDWTPGELETQEVVAYLDGSEVTRGRGANVLGHPLDALAWLANDLAERGDELRAGELVTTGCCTAVVEASPGARVVADFGRFGRVSVRFARAGAAPARDG